ncbi:MAG: hypothetical protein Q4D58_11465 [Synergistaceae bacterium]|nr:hypothetical protein [Synergistaceae bacterium]
MTVYDMRDKNSGGISVNNLLYMIGGRFLDNMLARDAAAREYKYKSRLDAETAERSALEAQRVRDFELSKIDKGYARQDDLIGRHDAYVRENPHVIPGMGGAMGTFIALGGNADAAQYQRYLLPEQEQINTGDKIISRTLYPDGTHGGATSFNVGLSPKEAGELGVKQGELDSMRRYRNGMLANDRDRIFQEHTPMWTLLDGYVDENGNLVERDQWGNRRPATGIKPVMPEEDPLARDLRILSLLEGDKSGAGGRPAFRGYGAEGGGNLQKLKEIVADRIAKRLSPQEADDGRQRGPSGAPEQSSGGTFEAAVKRYAELTGLSEDEARRVLAQRRK